MKKPYIIIHTHTSIDGNIDIMDLSEFEEASRQYQELSLGSQKEKLNIQGYLNGKNSTEDHVTFYKKPELNEDAPIVPEGDYIADSNTPMYYVSIDPKGELAFETNTFGYGGIDSHFIEVLTEQASNAYKDFLKRKQISYIIAGEESIDYNTMLDKLYRLFNIKRLMVGGGGTINWSFVQSGLVDEVSVILAPIANADPNGHRFFVAKEPYSSVKATSFQLNSVEELEHGTLWIRYSIKTAE